MERTFGVVALVMGLVGCGSDEFSVNEGGSVAFGLTGPTGELTTGQVILDCDVESGYEVDQWRDSDPSGAGLWIGAVYQTHGEHSGDNHPVGTATVDFSLPGSHVLALSSYEPVDWVLTVGPDTTLEKVLLFGYHQQTLSAPEGLAVEYVEGPACGYAWPGDDQGCDTEGLVAAAEAAAGLPLAGFDGCYDASDFVWALGSSEGDGDDDEVDEDEGECVNADGTVADFDDDGAVDPGDCGTNADGSSADCGGDTGGQGDPGDDCVNADGTVGDCEDQDEPAADPGSTFGLSPLVGAPPVISDCDVASGYETYRYVQASGEAGLLVASVYQTPAGVASVTVSTPGDHVLALSSYEAVTWDVVVGPESTVSKIFVAGYGDQVVNAGGIPVEVVEGPACGYSVPYNGGGCETGELLGAFEAASGLAIGHFEGCYDASDFDWQ
jgi:hypothetical protein